MANNLDVARDPGKASPQEVNAYLDKIDTAARFVNFQIGRMTELLKDLSAAPEVRAGILSDIAELDSASGILAEQRRLVVNTVLSGVRPPSDELIALTKVAVQSLEKITLKSNNAAQALRTATGVLAGATSVITGKV